MESLNTHIYICIYIYNWLPLSPIYIYIYVCSVIPPANWLPLSHIYIYMGESGNQLAGGITEHTYIYIYMGESGNQLYIYIYIYVCSVIPPANWLPLSPIYIYIWERVVTS